MNRINVGATVAHATAALVDVYEPKRIEIVL